MGKHKNVEDYIREKTTDTTLRAHLFGIMRECGFEGGAYGKVIDAHDASRLWDRFGTYTGVSVHAERMHGGTEVHLNQFVDSAVESWRTQHG